MFQRSYDELKNCTGPTLLIIDEAQVWFTPTMKPLWNSLRELVQNRTTKLRVLILAMYGDTSENVSPAIGEGNASVSLPSLLLNFQGVKDLSSRICRLEMMTPLTDKVIMKVFEYFGGHVGLSSTALTNIMRTQANASTEAQIQYLFSRPFFDVLLSSRAFKWMAHWVEPNEVFRSIVRRASSNSTLEFTPSTTKAFTKFQLEGVKRGAWFQVNGLFGGGNYKFTSMFAFDCMYNSMFTGKLHLQASREGFVVFLKACLERMSAKRLRDQKPTLQEDLVRCELYTAATEAVAADNKRLIRIDYCGNLPASSNKLDLFVDTGFDWGVELCLSDPKGHLKRFAQNGNYYGLKLKEWAVVLVVDHLPKDYPVNANLWILVYNPNFSSFRLYNNGIATEHLFYKY